MSPLLQQLIDALKCLPGVGPKSAQRMAFHLLERDRTGAKNLARALIEAVENIGHCQSCRNATGAAFSTWVGFDAPQIRWTTDEPSYFSSSKGVRRGFCWMWTARCLLS